MTDELRFRDKAELLFDEGFLREADLFDASRILSRWELRQNVPQKTISDFSPENLKGIMTE